MKELAVLFDVLGVLAGAGSAFLWLKSSQVKWPDFLLSHIDGREQARAMSEMAEFNRRAAVWMAVSIGLAVAGNVFRSLS